MAVGAIPWLGSLPIGAHGNRNIGRMMFDIQENAHHPPAQVWWLGLERFGAAPMIWFETVQRRS